MGEDHNTPQASMQDTQQGSGSELLTAFSLSKNPFTDRTAERSKLSLASIYTHSDLQGFVPSETTYVIFGRRGSGKTTIRMQMEDAYSIMSQNDPKSAPFFIVDLCTPGCLTVSSMDSAVRSLASCSRFMPLMRGRTGVQACLRHFQERIGCSEENWDSQFSGSWSSADLIDCVLSYAATALLDDIISPEDRGRLERIKRDPRMSRQVLLLCHLYAIGDSAELARLRALLVPPAGGRVGLAMAAAGASAAVAAGVGTYATLRDSGALAASDVGEALSAAGRKVAREVARTHHPRLAVAAVGLGTIAAWGLYSRRTRLAHSKRAAEVAAHVRVAPRRDVSGLLSILFPGLEDTAESIRSQYIGISAHQKLQLLSSLLREGCGYQGLAIFGDCFDEVSLLDPVRYPQAIKRFAHEVCKNDVLSFGRMYFFFPDSRVGLDLSTTKVLQEARFDRHFVRDLTWSRHQLAALAEKRFRAFQGDSARTHLQPLREFKDLFGTCSMEDFHASLAKLQTPRELMIMMTEVLNRVEAHPGEGYEVTAQDLEIAVGRALEQAL